MKALRAMFAGGSALTALASDCFARNVTPAAAPVVRNSGKMICGLSKVKIGASQIKPATGAPYEAVDTLNAQFIAWGIEFKEKERSNMADKDSRLPQNAPGSWYVDSNCIDCDLCRETAPTVFRRDEDNGNSIVFHQPETEEELKLAQEAQEGCPVEAIGSDGGAVPVEAIKPSEVTESPPDGATRHG